MSKNSSRAVGRHALHIPGPTPLPDRVLRAMDTPIIDHRGPEFARLTKRCLEGLKTIFKTKNDVLIFASSGTGGLESAVANLFSPGDRVVVQVAGFFGERFAKIATAYRLDVRTIDYEWGRAIDAADVKAAAAKKIERRLAADHGKNVVVRK